jgi:hypothetical protein
MTGSWSRVAHAHTSKTGVAHAEGASAASAASVPQAATEQPRRSLCVRTRRETEQPRNGPLPPPREAALGTETAHAHLTTALTAGVRHVPRARGIASAATRTPTPTLTKHCPLLHTSAHAVTRLRNTPRSTTKRTRNRNRQRYLLPRRLRRLHHPPTPSYAQRAPSRSTCRSRCTMRLPAAASPDKHPMCVRCPRVPCTSSCNALSPSFSPY